MKFMISCRQPLALLKKATEIKVDYRDIDRMRDFVTEDWICGADVIIYIPKGEIIDWSLLNTYKELLNITIATEDTRMIEEIHEQGYRAFWSYPASSYWELRGLLNIGVDQVLLDAPLYFDIPKVKRICENVEIRLVVNKCMNNYMEREDGICGTYVRPEDVELYEEYVSHMEFDTSELQVERTLLKIYSEDKRWPGNLNLLLTSLNANVDNRGLSALPLVDDPLYFARRRIGCAQRCQEDPHICSFCRKSFNLINKIDKNAKKILEKIEEIDNKTENDA